MDRIAAQHLHKTFGSLTAVDQVSLRVGAGEIYGLVGPDGAGKTTTLRLLCGALTLSPAPGRPAASIQIDGIDLLRRTEQARAVLGYLPQRFSLYDDLTVMENLRFFAEVRGLARAEWQPRCLEILAFVGLDAFQDRRAGQLSGGMKQKLGLAAALVHQPRVLLLDEPTTGVDPVTRQDFWQLIIRLVSARSPEERPAVLVSTPYMDEADRCGQVGFMRDGGLVVEGSPASLRRTLEDRVLELAGNPLPLLRAISSRQAGVQQVQMFGDRLHIRVKPGQGQSVIDQLRASIPAAGGEVTRLQRTEPQLEDVFMHLLEGEGE
jgi:ABC-2 type transport system ATP-binding protein